jgi:hypothetical protein
MLVTQPRFDPVLGPYAGLVGVEDTDAVHVDRHVTGQLNGGAEPRGHRGAIHVAQRHRHPGLAGDAVEPGLPMRVALARAVGCDDESEHFARAHLRDDVADDAAGLPAVDGNAAQCAHDGSAPACEQRVLAHPAHVDAEPPGDGQHEHEVPVRGVRGADQHGRAGGSGLGLQRPPAERPEHPCEKATEHVSTLGERTCAPGHTKSRRRGRRLFQCACVKRAGGAA